MFRKTSIRIVAVGLMATMSGLASAQIAITQFQANQAGGGMNIQAHYVVPPSFCCPPERLRWFQIIQLKDGNGNPKTIPPWYPNATFVDPQPAQPGGPWDNDPWYDVTYNSAADRTTDTNRQNGKGRFMNDSPAGWTPYGPMSFNATTLVVCIDEAAKTFRYVGGFTWGFNVAAPPANPAISLINWAPIGDSAALRNFANGALANGGGNMPQWSMVENTACTLNTIPEPASMAALAMGLGVVLKRRRKNR